MSAGNARNVFKTLNGIVCLYKPACVSVKQVQHKLITNLCKSLNALPDRPQERQVQILGSTNSPMTVEVTLNHADNPLVIGQKYQSNDFRSSYATHLGLFTSGVLLIGINEGTRKTYKINVSRNTRAYKVVGKFGKATDTYFSNGKTVEVASYGHVKREHIDRITAHMQAAHQRKMFEVCGVHVESQTAFELAKQGLVRPSSNKIPVVYGIKCVHYQAPFFTLEIQAVNEYENYLCVLVHELGVQLKTTAHCTSVQCIRHGKFDVSLALLRKYWHLPFVLENMQQCDIILDENENLLQPKSALLH